MAIVQALGEFARKDWGTVQVGQTPVSLRLLAGAGLTIGWVVLLMVQTASGAALDALWTNVVVVAGLVVLASFTRSIGFGQVVTLFFAGGSMVGAALLGAQLFEVFNDNPVGTRQYVIPIMEETLKLVPVGLVLWSGWRSRTWSLGATDLLLMGAASGAGFAVVEDAYIRHNFPSLDSLVWLPSSVVFGGQLIAGHGVWTAIAAGTIGFALLLRSRGTLALAVAAAGPVWSVLDHIRNNHGRGFLDSLMSDGYVTAWIFAAAVIAAIAADIYVQRTVPDVAELQPPAFGNDVKTFLPAWRYRLMKRSFYYAAFQTRRASGPRREEADAVSWPLFRGLAGEPPPAAPGA